MDFGGVFYPARKMQFALANVGASCPLKHGGGRRPILHLFPAPELKRKKTDIH